MIRTVLAVMAGLMAGIAGMRQTRTMRMNAARLTRWVQLMKHLSLILSEGALTLPEAFEQTALEPAEPDRVFRTLAQGMRSSPLTPLPELLEQQPSCGPEHTVLLRWVSGVCRGSLRSRCQATDDACAELTLLAAEATDKCTRDARMWTTLGWVGGACLTLLLI